MKSDWYKDIKQGDHLRWISKENLTDIVIQATSDVTETPNYYTFSGIVIMSNSDMSPIGKNYKGIAIGKDNFSDRWEITKL